MCREMKDSGIEWIGEINNEWSIVKIAKLAQFINGYAFNGEDLTIENEIPVIRIGDIQEGEVNLERCLKYKKDEKLYLYSIQSKDVLIAMSGATTGKTAFINEVDSVAYINQRVGIIRNSKYSKYINYSLNTGEFKKYIDLLADGSAQPNISTKGIMNYYLALPNKGLDNIINYLDKKVSQINDIISKQKSLIEKYKAYKQSIITETVTKGLNKNVSMKDSGIEWIGEIPKHWDITKIGNIAEVGSGGTPNRQNKELWNGNINWMSSGEVNMQYVYETKEKITESGLNSISSPLLPVNTVMLGLIGQGKTKGMTAILCVESACNQNLAYCICKKEIYHHKYLFYSFKAMYKFLRGVIGESQAGIYLGFLKECKIIVPSIEEQKEITDFLDKKCEAIDSAISKKEQLIEKLESYKKSLIYECVTGKREVN